MHDIGSIDPKLSKQAKYDALVPQVKSLLEGEHNHIANMANLAAVLKSTFDFLWVGFYLVDGDSLVLGPFQGPLACTRLYRGKGVCAAAWERNETVVVPDVEAFPGHVACSSLSRSEVVLPVRNRGGEVFAVLDVDSITVDDFDRHDVDGLERIVSVLEACL